LNFVASFAKLFLIIFEDSDAVDYSEDSIFPLKHTAVGWDREFSAVAYGDIEPRCGAHSDFEPRCGAHSDFEPQCGAHSDFEPRCGAHSDFEARCGAHSGDIESSLWHTAALFFEL
jgi:hypothetical protein